MTTPTPRPDRDHDDFSPASTSQNSDRVVIKLAEILRGKTEIWIEHGSEMYRLRLTRAGKLLLSK